MVIYGYTKDYFYTGDGTLFIRIRVPSIHGPYRQSDHNGKSSKNYVRDENLPYYPSLLLPHLPTDGEVAALLAIDNANHNFLVIGLTGGSYSAGVTNLGG